MDNYPDDIRQYDNHPQSPFYEPVECPVCGMDDCEYCDWREWEDTAGWEIDDE